MALTYGFYNSLNGDRKYHAEQMSSIFDGVINDGIFAGIGEQLAVGAGSGMQVIVKSGRAWFNHTWTLNDGNLTLPIDAADSNLGRIDAVVLEVDHTDAVRANAIKVIKGKPTSLPSLPELAPSTGAAKTHHLLAEVSVKAGVASITGADITSKVGTGSAPLVTSVLQQTDISSLYEQWKAQFDADLKEWKDEFDAWFDHIQTTVSEEVVTNLQQQIIKNKITKETLTAMGLTRSSDGNQEAFAKLWTIVTAITDGKAMVSAKFTLEGGTPLANFPILGITDETGNTKKTDSSGNISGYLPADTGTYIGIKGYADLQDTGETLHPTAGQDITGKSYTVKKNTTLTVTSSKSLTFSSVLRTVDVFAVGGGGGGAGGVNFGSTTSGLLISGGDGGYGGEIKKQTGISASGKMINVIIGAGGAGGVINGGYDSSTLNQWDGPTAPLADKSLTKAGGNTTISSLNITAKGGGPNNYTGAAGGDGNFNTVVSAASGTGGESGYGGGGGGAGVTPGEGVNGGGNGGNNQHPTGYNGQVNTGGGGGGGTVYGDAYKGGNGGSGVVKLTFHF